MGNQSMDRTALLLILQVDGPVWTVGPRSGQFASAETVNLATLFIKILPTLASADVYDLCDVEGGWHPYDSHCYKYFADAREWNAANEACGRESGHLIMLENSAKYHILSEVIDCTDYDHGIWIGLSDTVCEPISYSDSVAVNPLIFVEYNDAIQVGGRFQS
jgi:hypothetical protein